MATTAQPVAEVCAQAKRAAHELATLDTATKNAALEAMAEALEQRSHEILEANTRDMEAGLEAGLHSGLLDRLKLTDERIAGIARDVRAIAALPDPVGETIEGHRLEHGLDVRRVRVLLGALPEVRERDRAARVIHGGALERGAGAGRRQRGPVGRAARRCHLDRERRRPRRAAPARHAG